MAAQISIMYVHVVDVDVYYDDAVVANKHYMEEPLVSGFTRGRSLKHRKNCECCPVSQLNVR